MINILLAILFSSLLYIVFKGFGKFSINTFQAILINYIVAFILGTLISKNSFQLSEVHTKSWFPFTLILGFLFITVFYVIGKTTQVNGLTVASVASKMSMIIPIAYGILIFNEQATLKHQTGIVVALSAVYCVSIRPNEKINLSHFQLPLLLFFGAGIIDTLINITQHSFLLKEETAFFSSFTFLMAFIFGLIFLTYRQLKTKIQFSLKDIIGGIILGVPNYFSLYFLTKALQNEDMDSPTIFTILNIGVILLTTFVGILFFKEKMSKKNYIGILLSILALFLVTH